MGDLVENLFLNNLHRDVTESILKNDLVSQFPEFFADAKNVGTLKVKVYKRDKEVDGQKTGGIQVLATVAGVRVNIDDLLKKSVGKKLFGFAYKFHMDKGDARDEHGHFITKMSTQDRRRLKDLVGSSRRRIQLPLTKSVSQSLQKSFQNSHITWVNDKTLTKEELFASYVQKTDDILLVQYESALDCLQSICKLNNSLRGSQRRVAPGTTQKITFLDKETRKVCTFSKQCGIEIQTEVGYIPFKMLDKRIVDIVSMRAIPSNCLVCGGSFEYYGLDKNLQFVAAKCTGCSYKKDREVDDRAYTWPNEGFTRLIELRRVSHSGTYLDVWFKPMQQQYSSGKEFRSVVQPLVDWEWYQSYQNFSAQKQKVSIIEATLHEQNEDTHGFLVTFDVSKTSLWTLEGFDAVGSIEVTAKVVVNKAKIHQTTKECQHYTLEENEDGKTTTVTVLLTLQRNEKLKENDPITVCPVPDKMFYNAVKRFMRRWEFGYVKTPWLKSVLNIGMANPVALPINVDNFENPRVKERYNFLRADLNEFQLTALDNALKYATSIIIGPPGTGKTWTSAQILTTIKTLVPEGKAIALCPSNYGCDVLANAISDALDFFYPECRPFTVLRVHAKRHEAKLRLNDERPSYHKNVRCLHTEVDRMIEEGKNEPLKNFHKIFINEEYLEESKEDTESYFEEIRKIEGQILNDSKYKILVVTAGAMQDKRFREKGYKPRVKVDIILIDEAGFLNHVEALASLDYAQDRVIYVGDDRQLRKIVYNRSVDMTGYANSTIEWARMLNSNLPLVTLRVQYRMNPTICNLVSDLTYPDTPLETAESVPKEIPEAIASSFNMKNPVYVVFHSGRDKMIGTSYVNHLECDIVQRICERFLAAGLSTKQILVTTLYGEQKKLLSEKLNHLDIDAKTVDSQQGKESDIVIASFVRSGENRVGFAKNANRLNVMLSRAKHFMVIVVNKASLSSSPIQVIKKFFELIKLYGNVVDGEKLLKGND